MNWKRFFSPLLRRNVENALSRQQPRPSTRRFSLEHLEARCLLAAVPTATLVNMPANPFIGEQISFTARFDNTHPTDVGYGPYIDLFLPATGVDGAGAAIDDGISFVSATYLGIPVTTTVLTLTAGGVAHPYAVDTAGNPLIISIPAGFQAGDQLIVMQLPFGSFASDQPAADVTITANISNLADLNAPLPVRVRGGFQFGNDPLNNPATDPTIVGAATTQNVSPTLLRLTKTYIGPEDETATGPNFPRRYIVTADLAPGQTLTDFDLTDVLPSNMQFLQLLDTRVNGASVATTAISTPDGLPTPLTPGGTLTRRFASVTGTNAANDVEMEFEFFIPLNDAVGNPVLPPTTGDDRTSVNDAQAQGSWNPIDARDPDTVVTSNVTPNDHTLENQAIAVQKSVSVVIDTGAAGPSPGDTLEYVIDFQVSDYFAFQNVILRDVFSDGQVLTGTPTLTVTEHGATSAAAVFNLANFTLTTNLANPPEAPGTLGSDLIVFRVSDELITRGGSFADGQLVGGAIPDGGTGGPVPPSYFPFPFGATTGQIRFRTVIQDQFELDFPSGDPSLDQGDVLNNNANITGDVLNVADLTPTGNSESDDTAASVSIMRGTLSKIIYAINGVVAADPDAGYANRIEVAPGDVVTYRLQATLPTSDFEQLRLTDFLPLPVYDASTISTVFNTTVSAAAPVSGQAKFGPSDTFFGISGVTPIVTIDTVSNSVRFNYGDFDDPLNRFSTIDILFSVTVSNNPFADGLFLTNQVRLEEGDTFLQTAVQDSIIQITLTEPSITNIQKGVVATDGTGTFTPATVGPVAFNAPGTAGARFAGTINSTNLGTSPINSNLTNADAGDLVTFAIVIENTGSSRKGVFDIRLTDTLPAGFAIPGGGAGLNLRITDGTGAVINFLDLGGGLFGAGIELLDPGPTPEVPADGSDGGALDEFDPTDGRNIAIITYDLLLTSAVAPSQTLINTATLTNYAGTEGGPDHTAEDPTDTASVTTRAPDATKTIDSTSEAHTGVVTGTERVAIGEIIRYRVVVDLPEGTSTNLRIRDNLPSGLTFLNDGTATVAFVSNGAGITSSTLSGAGLAQSGDQTTIGTINPTFVLPVGAITGGPFNTGTDPTFILGDVGNTDSDDDREFVVIEFNALVDNTVAGSNDTGDNRANTVDVLVNGTSLDTSPAVTVRIAEPLLTIAKGVSPTLADAGDTVTFTVTINSASGADRTSAFDWRFTDVLPASLILTGYTPTLPAGVNIVTDASNIGANSIDLLFDRIDPGQTVTITITATVVNNVTPGQVITNTGGITYTSLPGTNGTTVNPTGSSTPGGPGTGTGERTGSGVAPNDYVANDPADVTIFSPDPQKSIVATSEGSTLGNNVTIGEIVRYRMVVRVPESSSLTNVQLVDALPAGLTFLNDNTALIAFVSNGAGISSTTLAGAGLVQAGNETTVGTITPSFVLPAGAITGGPFGTGTDVTFNLGDLVNADSDADQEFVVIEFNALVDNTVAGSNDAGDTRDNTFTIFTDGVQRGGPSSTVTVTIVEPNVTTVKQAISTDGTTVTYQVVLTNTGSATAFDSVFRDTLPAQLDLLVGSITISPASGTPNHSDPLNRVEFTDLTIAVGGTVTITYQATIVTPGVTITNTANTNWTSLPGPNGTTANPTGSSTPGGSGTDTGERDSSGGQNDYSSSDSETLGSLGDRIWYDIDGDGVQDGGEPGIGSVGVTVRWFGPDGIEGNGDDSVINTTTDASGNYLVSGLPLGTGANNYRVTVNTATLPTGLTTNTFDLDNGTVAPNNNSVVALSGGNANPRNVDFGYRGTASLGDRVWIDSDGDGTQDAVALEPGLPGVGVTLTWFGRDGVVGGGDDVIFTTTTDNAGNYQFVNLPAGNFQVDINPATLPSNVTQTFDLNGPLDNSATRTLTTGENATDVDFGYRGAASIGDTVWYDVDGNTVQNNAEPGIPGATVTLTWSGPDGILGNSDDVTFQTTTDANGNYSFPGLPVNGTDDPYRVTVSVPAGFTTQTVDSDGLGTPNQSTLNLGANENNVVQDFGYRGDLSQGLGNFVWEDLNGNGRQDGVEPGIDGVRVELRDSTGTNILAVTTTSGGGLYSFPGLVTGDYQVFFSNSDGTTTYARTVANSAVATDTTDSDANVSTGLTGLVTVSAGAFNDTVDAGLYRPSSVGDRVWYDINGNGVQDAGEPGIPGATVTVTWLGPDGVAGGGDDQVFPATTGPNGIWNINNLPPGNYTAAVSNLPNGLTQQTFGVPSFTLPSGTNRDDVDFGFLGVGQIGDRVWYDPNLDGSDVGEPGIATVTVNLTWFGFDGVAGGGDDLNFTAVTNGTGNYNFTDLPLGNYQVAVATATLPVGLIPTYDLDGGTAAPNNQTAVTLTQADPIEDGADFGYTGQRSIGDRIWHDIDGDGVQDPNEPGLAGVTVTATWAGPNNILGDGDDVVLTRITGPNGVYLFDSIPQGVYRVAVTGGLPPGVINTGDPDGTFDQSTQLTLGVNDIRRDIDFGYQGQSSVAGFVYRDFDIDSLREPTGANPETGIGGVLLTLTGTDVAGNTITRLIGTNPDGSYSFTGLLAGTYTISETQPPGPTTPFGFYDGLDRVGTINGTQVGTQLANDQLQVALGTAENGIEYNFGEIPPADPFGFVWVDLDNDGIREAGEPGIPNVAVTISGTAFAGTPLARPLVPADLPGNSLTVFTNAAGRWEFPLMPPGLYSVVESQPAGYVDGREQNSDPNGPPPIIGNDRFDNIVLNPFPIRGPFNFGEIAGNGVIAGATYVDANNNGIREGHEMGIQGVLITLTGVDLTGRTVFTRVVTDRNGNYVFRKVRPGTYRITQTQPVAFLDGRDTAGTTGGIAGNDVLSSVRLGVNQVSMRNNFGERGVDPVFVSKRFFISGGSMADLMGPAGSGIAFVNPVADPSGYVYVDANANGRRDYGEVGIAGVLIELRGVSRDGRVVNLYQVTNARGFYQFDNLPAGVYSLIQTQPAGYRDGQETLGSLGGIVENDRFSQIVLPPGGNGINYNFGELPFSPPPARRRR
jgi:uncharacterized repeat protein (TIGR01451 family)/fimbrial isopeptide formation D2 family protein